MNKKFLAICLSVVVLVALIAVLVPGCDGVTCTGEIEVKATLCDDPWEGPVQYKLTGPGATAPTVINGNNVTALFDNVDCGDWTLSDVSGGPPGAYLVDITPNPTQTLTGGGTITFTLNFELEQDAWIEFDTWTINGIPIAEYPDAEYYEGEWYAEVHPCHVIDVHFLQGVKGCEEVVAAVNETSTLQITQVFNPPGVKVYVVNDYCAVNKTVEQAPEPDKGEQVPSFNGLPVDEMYYSLPTEGPTLLDVETEWWLTKCLNYTKSINWLGISVGPFDPPEPHPCVLFELIVPGPGIYVFSLVAEAEVELVDDEDVDMANNKAVSPLLTLTVTAP